MALIDRIEEEEEEPVAVAVVPSAEPKVLNSGISKAFYPANSLALLNIFWNSGGLETFSSFLLLLDR